MTVNELKDIIRIHGEELRGMGVATLAVFGSVARNESRPDSDVDLLVEFSRPTGFFGLFRLQEKLEELIGRKVDVGTPTSLRPRLKSRVLSEAIRVV